jgi:hypothetical protein
MGGELMICSRDAFLEDGFVGTWGGLEFVIRSGVVHVLKLLAGWGDGSGCFGGSDREEIATYYPGIGDEFACF